MEETQDVVVSMRISRRLKAKIVAEQERIAVASGIKPNLQDMYRMLLERSLEKPSKKRKRRNGS